VTDPDSGIGVRAGDERAGGVVEQHAHGDAQASSAQATLQQRRHVHALHAAALEALCPRHQLARHDRVLAHRERERKSCKFNSLLHFAH
jgi:hypothetical protein